MAGSSLVQNQLMLVLRPQVAVLANSPCRSLQCRVLHLLRLLLLLLLLLRSLRLLLVPLVPLVPPAEDRYQVQMDTVILPRNPEGRSVTRRCRHPQTKWDRQRRPA